MGGSDIDNFASEINSEKYQLPAVIAKNDNTVKKSFWKKFIRVARFIPFAQELLSAYYCAIDPDTPTRVRAILLTALVYFIVPTDFIPDFIAGLGFSDDATVLTAAISLVAGHISDVHRTSAQQFMKNLSQQD